MAVGTGISRNGAKQKQKGDKWSCGCTTIFGPAQLKAECLICGGTFVRIGQKQANHAPRVSISSGEKILELVTDSGGEESPGTKCDRCTGQGWIKAYTQEWDRIKCHHAPCPVCQAREWLDWSADKRLMTITPK
ncbi:hypothetical protein DCCM_2139 [Desulfocucumis palustris]|uniref:Uncharacterized protein n=1 Tax=Desulfocucumis palustris TaxID=1898651 RepID=A0A2L2XAF9_9FIRM|nr:hypothetical protein [Desulfocucumis palustris]GBF33042.1 hypothetical protein DCCM_2139 [Desulfocucumis palustris]